MIGEIRAPSWNNRRASPGAKGRVAFSTRQPQLTSPEDNDTLEGDAVVDDRPVLLSRIESFHRRLLTARTISDQCSVETNQIRIVGHRYAFIGPVEA